MRCPSMRSSPRTYTTQAALYTATTQYIAISLIGRWPSLTGAIFFIRELTTPEANKNNVLARMLEAKEAIISPELGIPVSSVSTTLALTSTTDVVVAFRYPEKQIWWSRSSLSSFQPPVASCFYRMDVFLSNADAFASTAWPKLRRCLAAWLDEAIQLGNHDVFCRSGPGGLPLFPLTPRPWTAVTTTLSWSKGWHSNAQGSKLNG